MGSKEVGFLLTVVMLVLVFDCGNCNMQQFEVARSIRYNAAIRVEDSEFALHRDSRSVHRSRRSVLNSTEIMEAIEDHNRVRRLEGSSNMEIMIWDADLAIIAERSANICIWNHTNTGQNLYATTDARPINLTAAIMAWYNEKIYYNNYYITKQCNPPNEPCLHYSQVVWATSRKLGCAYTRCPTLYLTNWTSPALFLVCNYDPPGNVEGLMPYQSGNACSRCATGSWWCNNGLCDRSCTVAGSTCGCTPICQNNGSVNSASCSCSCTTGWWGSDCSDVCKNYDSNCDPQPGQRGWPPSYCTDSQYGPTVREKCPKMCNQCQAVGDSTSMKPSLLSMMSILVSWLLIDSIRSI